MAGDRKLRTTGRPQQPERSLDGFQWSRTTEARLNGAIFRAFSGPAGQEALAYLKNITLNQALPPEATDAQIRHREGQRWIVAVIVARLKAAESNDDASLEAQPDMDGPDDAGG